MKPIALLLSSALLLPSVANAETQQLAITVTIDDLALFWREIVIGVLLLYIWYLRAKLKKRSKQTTLKRTSQKTANKYRHLNPHELSVLELQELQRLARQGGAK
jgi:uncharacterized membrane protein YciS (DUF1049 family)